MDRRSFLQVSVFFPAVLAGLSATSSAYAQHLLPHTSRGNAATHQGNTDLLPGELATVLSAAAASALAAYRWKDRGQAPIGYIKGMAVMYARASRAYKAGDLATQEMASANTDNASSDALAWYARVFDAARMDNRTAGIDTLRHLFVMLTGLGMRESSGRYCEGRDVSASNLASDTAEAGLFQVSYNASIASPLLEQLTQRYRGSTELLPVFKEGVSCKASDMENFGEGSGREFQRLTKACPAFAVEFAAVALRNVRSHWGPINARAAEIRPECDLLFQQVEQLISRAQ